MNPARAYSAVLCLAFLAIAAVAAGTLAAAAPAAGPAGGTIRIPLPESNVAVHVDENGFCSFSRADILQIGQTGQPSIPYKSVRVLLPPNADLATVKATIAGARWILIDGDYDIRPVPPLAVGDGQEASAVWPADRDIVDGKDTDIYENDALFPIEAVRKVDTQVMRGWKMAQILYAPYAYSPVEKKLFELSGDAIEITFERTPLKGSQAGADLTAAGKVRETTINFAEISGEYGGYAVSADSGRYVIITTDNIEAASGNLMDFVASKEARGFTVQVATEETWGGGIGNTAAENIRSWLKSNYATLNIKYVLLVGNPHPSSGNVPMKMCYCYHTEGFPPVTTTFDVPTDFYYAELTSNWDGDGDGKYGEYDDDFSGNPPRAAEVTVGRIPYYGTITDLDDILSKIIAYENAPAASTIWREKALLPMKPSDPSTPGYQLGEEIKNTVLIPNVWTYYRVYDSDYGLSPAPDKTTCNVTNVTNAWNGSDFGAIFWWTHGSQTSSQDIMDLSHAATLDDDHPGFTFQCSCRNGWPEVSNNLGYSLLKNGCIATVSASRDSWYEVGQTSFAGSATNSGMTFEYSKRLIAEEMYAGDALNDLRLDVSPYPYEELWMNYLDFNLYGCPAVGPFTSTPDQAAPSVLTYHASSLTTTSARLRANLTSVGTADNVTVSFVWGTSPGGPYPNETTGQLMTATGAFYHDLGSLVPGTAYYYKAKSTGNGITLGLEKSFTTLTTPPSVITNDASNITATSARLSGNLSSLGTAESVAVSFQWGLTTSYGNVTTSQPKTAVGSFSADLTALTAKTTYHFRAKAVGDGTVWGEDHTFTTSTLPPSVTTNDATNLTTTSARLNGNLSSKGTASSVSVSFEWGLTPSYGNETPVEVKTGAGTFYFSRGGLTPGTTYYYRAKADGDGDPVYGLEETFTTLTTPPSVSTGDASNVTDDGARLNGNLSSKGTADNVAVSFQWGTTSDNYDYETVFEMKSITGTFYFDLSGLASDTTFYYRAKAVGHGEPQFGDEKSFKTSATLPAVSTGSATGITTTSATLNGNLISKGTAVSVTVSFLWGMADGGPYTKTTAGQPKDDTGAFSADLSDLPPGTTYYFISKAVGDGSDEGDQMSFTTLKLPTVNTNDATNLAATSARINGDLDDLGTATSVTVSFQWGTASGDYTYETSPEVKDATGTIYFNLSALTPGATYYYRAKADGDGDPVHGEERTFTTLRVPVIANVNPATGWTGQNAVVSITGSNFTGATGVGFGPQITVDAFTVVSDAQISAAIRILCDGTPGSSDVSVTTAGGTATLIKGFAVTDLPPNQPLNAAPVDRASVRTLTPTLSSLAFSHPCVSRTHTASQWQVTAVSGDYTNPLFDSAADSANLTGISLPRGVIGEHELYCWRVRYRDSRGIWSDWSTETSFYRPDFIRAELSGSAEIRARDSSSRVTGSVDGEPRETIPYSDYFSDTVTVVSPTDSYRYEVVGTEDGAYALSVVRLVGNQSVAFQATRIPVSAGETHQYLIDWDALSRGERGVTIRIDSDGDGSFERTTIVEGEIDGAEFVSAASKHGTPAWVWILLGLGLLTASTGVLALSRAAAHKGQTGEVP